MLMAFLSEPGHSKRLLTPPSQPALCGLPPPLSCHEPRVEWVCLDPWNLTLITLLNG
jgi:hypothetical protein